MTRFRLADASEAEGRFTTKRPRSVGDFVNFPTNAQGASYPGQGYIWRVQDFEASSEQDVDGGCAP